MNGKRSQWNRREVLQTGLKGGTAAIAAAYGLRPDYALAQVPNEFDGTKFQLKAPESNPKRGGVLRYGITCRPPHFDVHQSGTINNLGSQGCMFDNLVRRDPRDSGKTIIPDLAHSWEISKDGKTYTFFLRKDVQFHDGADFTADDVKATYDLISKPPAGISIPRSILFSSVSEINVRDKHTIEFKLASPRPVNFIMSGFASGWNVIVRKKTLEDNQYNLRRVVDIPGTCPNAKKKPFDDPRVRRAVHLVFERAVLVDVVKDVAPMMVGGFIYPFSDFATPIKELETRPGYQTDPSAAVKEAKALLAAAGYKGGAPLDFLVRDVATFKLWAQAIQAMLQQSLVIESNLRTVVESVWFDDTKSGNFDLAVGAIVSTLLDPSDYFNA